MRFGELRGFTSLPIPRLHEQFRNEEVLTVLPVRDALTARETLLVATRHALAVLTAVQPPGGQWVTRWAPWAAVQLSDQSTPDTDHGAHRLTILVEGQRFDARLLGEAGRRALRDFVVAVRMSRPMRTTGR